MPAAAGVVQQGLRHEGDLQPVRLGLVEQDVLRQHGVVAGRGQVREPALDLLLPLRPNLVVVVAHGNAEVGHAGADLVAEVVVAVVRVAGVVRVLVERLAAVDAERGVVRARGVRRLGEDVELVLGTPVRGVGDARVAQRLLGPAREVAPVLAERRARIVGQVRLREHRQRGPLAERVDTRRVEVRAHHHVRGLDLEEAVARAVEADAVGADVLGEAREREGQVVQAAGQVEHLQVDELDAAGLGFLTNLGERLR